LIENFLIPSSVKTLVYGVEMRAITAGPGAMAYESPLGYAVNLPPGVEQTLLLWLLRHSALMQYRENLRGLIHGNRQLEANMLPGQNPGYATRAGQGGADFGMSFLSNNAQFAYSSAALSDLRSIAASCQQNHIECIVVNMPIHDLLFEKTSAADESQYESILQSEIVDKHVPMWDFNTQACRTSFGDDGFFNVLHLNTAGSQKFTAMIAMLYRQHLMGQPIPPDAPANCVKVY
jgi:hypothetical protein